MASRYYIRLLLFIKLLFIMASVLLTIRGFLIPIIDSLQILSKENLPLKTLKDALQATTEILGSSHEFCATNPRRASSIAVAMQHIMSSPTPVPVDDGVATFIQPLACSR